MKLKLIGLCVVVILTWMMYPTTSEARVMQKCEIVKELTAKKFPRTFISNWLCLIQSESDGDTMKVKHFGAYSKYGLFQINSDKWCGKGYYGGLCQVKCESLLTDSMDDANVACAKKYFERNGFNGWSEWVSKCRLKPMPSIQEC